MRILLLLLSYLFPALAFAAESSIAVADPSRFDQSVFKFSLTPEPSDISLNYLGYIFGNVDGVLQGAGSQILGSMFGVYNMAILSLGGIVLMYTLIVSTLNTAHEGEIMGKKWSSIWIPMRSAMGVALLIPKASGYSIIQILMMWITIQGIGAANSVWNAATTYLQMGGVLVVRPVELKGVGDASTSIQGTKNILLANDILRSMVCVASMEHVIKARQQQEIDRAKQAGVAPRSWALAPVDLVSTIKRKMDVIVKTNDETKQLESFKINYDPDIKIPGAGDQDNPLLSGIEGKCGTIKASAVDLGSAGAGANDIQALYKAGYSIDQVTALYTARSIAVIQMIYELAPAGRQIVNAAIQKVKDQNFNEFKLDSIIGTEVLRNASLTYSRLVSPAINNNFVTTMLRGEAERMRADGWLMAGSYFNTITRSAINQLAFDQNPAKFEVGTVPDAAAIEKALVPQYLTSSEVKKLFEQGNSVLETYIKNYGKELSFRDQSGAERSYADNARAMQTVPLFSTLSGLIPSGAGAAVDAVTHGLDRGWNEFFSRINEAIARTDIASPMTKLLTLGSAIIAASEFFIFTLLFIIAKISVATGFIPFVTVSVGVNTLTLWLAPIILSLILSLWGFSAIMAYYIPLIPYLMFTFVSLGWFFSVIESMIAAPLIGLGLIHPEGDGAFGKAESAIMLIVNVFLKPTLIIFGFVSGIIASYIALWLLNRGFGYVYVTSIFQAGFIASPINVILALVVFLGTYAITALLVIQRCFNLIHEVPARVLGWIGHREQDYGLHQTVSETRSGAQSTMGKLGSAAGEFQRGLSQQKQMEDKRAAKAGQIGLKQPAPAPSSDTGEARDGGAGGGDDDKPDGDTSSKSKTVKKDKKP